MGLWEAVIAIVAMGIISDTVGKVLKTRSKARADDSKVKSLTDKIDALNAQLSELSIENETLKTELEEQKILADEAVSTFGSGLERLRKAKDAAQVSEPVQQASET